METRRWVNPSMPIPLVAATALLYVGAALAILFAVANRSWFDALASTFLMSAAFLTANQRSIGWFLGAVATGAQTLAPFAAMVGNFGDNFRMTALLGVLIPACTFALLVHPTSRDFQRVWFT